IHTWERTWQYMKKAGTVILGISIILWAMMTFPGLDESSVAQFDAKRTEITDTVPASVLGEIEQAGEDTELTPQAAAVQEALAEIDGQEAQAGLRNSIAGRIGVALESVSKLAGFDWRTNIALVGGFAAKEVVVSTLGTAYSLGEVDPEETGSLAERLAKAPGWGPLTAFSLMIFTIFYAPCFVTVVCIARETGSWKWAGFSVVFNTALAFGLSVAVYQVGSLVL
ncbi:MAG: ferrous iron transport protein B, partial [Desulfobacterales bacterium]|nr:ferrous iron transport protein B [Desulfobacterales bacterium]